MVPLISGSSWCASELTFWSLFFIFMVTSFVERIVKGVLTVKSIFCDDNVINLRWCPTYIISVGKQYTAVLWETTNIRNISPIHKSYVPICERPSQLQSVEAFHVPTFGFESVCSPMGMHPAYLSHLVRIEAIQYIHVHPLLTAIAVFTWTEEFAFFQATCFTLVRRLESKNWERVSKNAASTSTILILLVMERHFITLPSITYDIGCDLHVHIS